jgi:outer membrane receptor protein involved in Fe transport
LLHDEEYNPMKKFLKIIIFLMLISTITFAGTSGKIAGVVSDSDTGEPLPGVNVYLQETSLGSATDIDGFYSILNVPPGNYTLKIDYIGYTSHEVTNIKVQIDLTTRIDVNLKAEVLEGETIVVVADRPLVTKDISNSQLNIEANVIETMPLETVNDVLTLQAGIETSSNGIMIRRGEVNQTKYMVDGLAQNDERSNYPLSIVSLSSVEELQVQTGGFNAEYGGVRSGVVNIITKEGSAIKYSGKASARYSPAASKHFGISVYDKYSYFNRPYFDPAVCWVGTQNGTWDTHTQDQNFIFRGWNAVSEETLQDENPDNDLTPDGAQRLLEWYHRREGDITKPDYVIDIGFGGPVPFLGNEFGNPRFYLSHYRQNNMFVFPIAREAHGENYTQLKLTTDITPAMKLVITGKYAEEHSVSSYQWTTTPNGTMLKTQLQVANLTNSSPRGRIIPFMPGYFSPGSVFRNLIGFKLTHTLSTNSLYEIKFQYMHNKNNIHQMEGRDTTPRYEIVPGYFVDEAPYGYYGYGTGGPAGTPLGGWMNLGRDSTTNSTTYLAADYLTQFDANNQIKTGFEFYYNDYDIKSSTVSPSMGTWTRSQIYREFPFRFGIYLQDKLEFEGFIANLGVRLDYSDGNTKNYLLDPYDEFFSGEDVELLTEDSKADWALSPRLGISHPITENSKIYFNYGHFLSEPLYSSHRFMIQREFSGDDVRYIGNPNLELEKTVAYELGYEQSLLDMMLLKVAGYYKDVTNQPPKYQSDWVLYRDNGGTTHWKPENNFYEDIRGLEITLTKSVGKWISGFFNYTYDVRSYGYFGLLEYNERNTDQQEYLRKPPEQERQHPRPYARANIHIHSPVDFGNEWLGFYPFGDWNLNLLFDWKTGRYETFNPQNLPGIVDDVQWRDLYNFDLRLSKQIDFGDFNINLYLDIENLFNHKYMSEAGFADNYDRLAYLESLNFSWETGAEKGDDRVGDYRPVGVAYDPLESNPDNDPEIKSRNDKRKEDKSYIDMPNITSLTFLNPRKFTFGIRISF